jgi:ribonuclease R
MTQTELREKVLQFLARHPNEEFKLSVLARRLSLTEQADSHLLQQVLKELAGTGEIRREEHKRYGYALPLAQHRLTGVLQLERSGGGTVHLKEPARGDVTITSKFLGTALDGDIVSVVPFGRDLPPSPQFEQPVEGEIVEVLVRNPRPIVGTFEKGKHFYFVVPDNLRIGRDIYIPKGKTHGAHPGQKVVARLETWESRNLNPEGSVIEVLGQSGEVHAEMKSVAREFSLPFAFPREVLGEADEISGTIDAREIEKRRDLRSVVC